MSTTVRAFAPGRVNLIGDHTDHTGGLVLPMAIDLGTTVEGSVGGDVVVLRSDWSGDVARVPLDVIDPSAIEPEWGRYVAGVVAQLRPSRGFEGTVSTTLPVGAGLSSSAALEVAIALALGAQGGLETALACQRAEQQASGVPCGVMDQLASVAGRADHALLIDCRTLAISAVPITPGLRVLVVHSGEARRLAGSAYADRVAACHAAETEIGPLRDSTHADVDTIADRTVRQRARHVVSENRRVTAFADALRAGDRAQIRALLAESHASLRDDFEVSTPALDDLVAELVATPGVLGARLTGAGFGGCAVAVTELDVPIPPGRRGWTVQPAEGARLL